MKFSELRFLTDENIDSEVVAFLRKEGFDVFDIKEEALWSMSDRDILEMAYQNQRIVVTQDSDFGTLIFRDLVNFCGVIYLRPGHQDPNVHIRTLKAIIETQLDFEFPFMLVGENLGTSVKVRYRLL